MKKFPSILAVLLVLALTFRTSAYSQEKTLQHPPCVENAIPHYVAYRTAVKPQIDGKLDEFVWQNAPRSPRFRDLVSGRETSRMSYSLAGTRVSTSSPLDRASLPETGLHGEKPDRAIPGREFAYQWHWTIKLREMEIS